jgi:hypothetical protein
VDPWLNPAIGAPEDVAGTLAVQSDGRCVFHAPRSSHAGAARPGPGASHRALACGCAIYAARPRSCEHFPFVCLIDARGVRVTLSHYCPTAAAMLVDHQGPLEIIEGPPVLADGSIPEGLDARDVLPPLERPGRLVDLDAFTEWEGELVRKCAVRGAACDVRGARVGGDRSCFELVRQALPPSLDWPEPPAGFDAIRTESIAANWQAVGPVLGRYLAARAFGSWVAYLGFTGGKGAEGAERAEGARGAVERSVEIAEAVFMIELVRQVDRSKQAGKAELIEALRRSDLLLLHYVDPEAFARGCW